MTVQEAGDGAVYVMASRGNAKEAGVQVGDVVVAVSAIFGDELWDVMHQGVDRVQGLIRSRAGDSVTLKLARGYEYHSEMNPESEDDLYLEDMDTLTMKDIFNFDDEKKLRRDLLVKGALGDGDENDKKVADFFQKLDNLLLDEQAGNVPVSDKDAEAVGNDMALPAMAVDLPQSLRDGEYATTSPSEDDMTLDPRILTGGRMSSEDDFKSRT